MDTTNSTVKTPEAETETPPRIPPAKLLPFSNGLFKRYPPLHLHGGNHPVVVTYRECLKNHAATIGGHAVDGCGEFMPSSTSCNSEPSSFKCAACGCHRNFHRRDPEESPVLPTNAVPSLEFQPLHCHQPPSPLPPPGNRVDSPINSPSPPPISSSYYPSAPHMLLALSHGVSTPPLDTAVKTLATPPSNPSSRKRFRTKFTQDQKEKMQEFSDKLEWKLQKKDDDLILKFCAEIGVDKGVLKVWMHNNKNNSSKKDNHQNPALIISDNNTEKPSPAPANGNSVIYSRGIAAAHGHQADDSNDSERNIIHRRETNQYQLQD